MVIGAPQGALSSGTLEEQDETLKGVDALIKNLQSVLMYTQIFCFM